MACEAEVWKDTLEYTVKCCKIGEVRIDRLGENREFLSNINCIYWDKC